MTKGRCGATYYVDRKTHSMDSLKIMEQEQTINEFTSVFEEILKSVGYEEAMVGNWMSIVQVAKTTYVARITLEHEVNEMLARLRSDQSGEIA